MYHYYAAALSVYQEDHTTSMVFFCAQNVSEKGNPE